MLGAMKPARSLIAAMTLFAALAAAPAGAQVLVELFTSQGCNSCPPADKIVADMAAREDVLALSVHVDYWDYIGWKDTFAAPAHTERQRAYQKTLGARYVYTPQAVIAGAAETVGSNRAELERAIRAAKRPSVAIEHDGRRLTIAAGEGGPAAVWLVRFEPRQEVDIARGENGGKRLAYANVVREWTRLGTWSGQALDLALEAAPGTKAAVILQKEGAGPGAVIGLRRLDRAAR
jgi:hypothetical protein